MTALIIDYVLLKGIYEEVHFTLVLKCANLFHHSSMLETELIHISNRAFHESWNALLLIWINSVPSMDEYMCSEMWGDITYQFLNLNICTIEV